MKTWSIALLLALLTTPALLAADGLGADRAEWEKSRQRGVDFLKNSQLEDGAWAQSEQVGVTALCTYGLLVSGLTPDDPAVAKALKKLESFAQKDGRICAEK